MLLQHCACLLILCVFAVAVHSQATAVSLQEATCTVRERHQHLANNSIGPSIASARRESLVSVILPVCSTIYTGELAMRTLLTAPAAQLLRRTDIAAPSCLRSPR